MRVDLVCRSISLSRSGLGGALPTVIGALPLLSRLDASLCSFTGSIPDVLSQLTALQYLDVSFNALSGTVPSNVGSSLR